jgi:hypothetical protein
MRDRDDEHEDDGEAAEEDLVALQAIAALLDVEGDDELAWAQREALAAVGDEALALKARREKRERREAVERRARMQERREREERARLEEERAARDEAERVEAARQARAARRASEERARERAVAERRERARREEEARRKAQRRPVEEMRPVPAPTAPRPAPPVERLPRPDVVARLPVVAPRVARPEPPAEKPFAPVTLVKEPERVHQVEDASLTGADLAGWRSRLGLTQQAAADRLGVRQGTVSKAEGKPRAALGPALRDALAGALRSESRSA